MRNVVAAIVLLSLLWIQPAHAAEVVGAGDIGTSGPGDTQTSDRVLAIDPVRVLTFGDHAYPDGTPTQFEEYYDPTWGRFKDITRPSPGNHDWHTAGAAGYEGYFGIRAGRLHSFMLDGVLYVSMDSNARISRQNEALRRLLARNDARCEVLYWHHPRWSSGRHGNQKVVAPWWRSAYRAGVDLVLNGHDHDYERFARKRPSGGTAADGIREIVVGTGGVETRQFGSRTVAGSRRRITGDEHWGVLRLRARGTTARGKYAWQFVDADTGDVLDEGSTRCHA
jgi:hypothetical protein